jgi:glycosyltransferase involved in cell wall biosynthesis
LPLVQARHIPLVFYLNTVKREVDPTLLGQVDRLLAPSVFLAQFYQERFGLDVSVLRPIVSPRLLVAGQGARFVTMVNPAPEKGVTLLYALAAEALVRLPQARFLVVEGRWTACAATGIGIPLRELPNVTVHGNQRDVRQAYARTRVLLYPSYWEEAYGRSIAEAQLSGIPVIASRRGGIPEALNGAGFLLDVPPRCLADYHAIPTRAEMRPWLAILRALLTHPSVLRRAPLRARHAAARGGSGATCDAVALLAQAAAGR